MKFKPFHNRALIELIEEDNKTSSGIVLPDTANIKKLSKGLVISVGQGKLEEGKYIPLLAKEGDKVFFSEPWSADRKFEEDGKKYYLVDGDDILGLFGTYE